MKDNLVINHYKGESIYLDTVGGTCIFSYQYNTGEVVTEDSNYKITLEDIEVVREYLELIESTRI